jgi:hypothetical protein
MPNSKSATPSYNNANTGAIFSNGAPLTDALLTGTWENAANAKFGLGISADTDGTRNIAVLNKQGGIVSKGQVVRVAGKSAKSPAYRGTLGAGKTALKIVLWDMGSFYQVRLDSGVPQRTVSDEALDFLGATLTTKPHAEIDQNGPF